MKKLGIITLHYIPNYGAVLQSYALKEVLQRFCNAEIIDYRQDSREKNFSPEIYIKSAIKNKSIRSLVILPIKLFKSRYNYGFRTVLKEFYKSKFNISNQIKKHELELLEKEYDGIIVGSDQVWNPKVLDGEYTLLLDFYNGKKYSYASSIGVKELSENESAIYKNNLQSFSCLSCREQAGTDIINKMFGKNICRTVLDPTLLLTSEEWNVESSNRLYKSGYILVYMVKYDERILDIMTYLKESAGMDVILITTPFVRAKLGSKGKGALYKIKPEEWLEYFGKAGFVLTNSFHGISFSINFNKQFYACFDEKSDPNGTNSRMENILDLFELNERIISDAKQINFDKNIDFGKVNALLAEERKKSFDYINLVIENYVRKT